MLCYCRAQERPACAPHGTTCAHLCSSATVFASARPGVARTSLLAPNPPAGLRSSVPHRGSGAPACAPPLALARSSKGSPGEQIVPTIMPGADTVLTERLMDRIVAF